MEVKLATVHFVLNPLQPLESVESRPVPIDGRTLAEIAAEFRQADHGLVAMVNEVEIACPEVYVPRPGDVIVVAATPAGGDALKMIALVVVAAVAFAAGQVYVGPALAGGMGLTATGSTAFAYAAVVGATAGLMAAGATMAMSAILGGAPASPLDAGKGAADSPTYSWQAKGNEDVEGMPRPALLAREVRVRPPRIGRYLTTENGKNYLHMLFAVCDGPASINREAPSLNDTFLWINNAPGQNFPGLEWNFRSWPQDGLNPNPLRWFGNRIWNVTPVNGFKLPRPSAPGASWSGVANIAADVDTGGVWIGGVQTTQGAPDSVRMSFYFPFGIANYTCNEWSMWDAGGAYMSFLIQRSQGDGQPWEDACTVTFWGTAANSFPAVDVPLNPAWNGAACKVRAICVGRLNNGDLEWNRWTEVITGDGDRDYTVERYSVGPSRGVASYMWGLDRVGSYTGQGQTTGNKVDALRFGLSFPRGLYWMSTDPKNQGPKPHSVEVVVDVRRKGTTDPWRGYRKTITATSTEPYTDEIVIEGLTPAQYEYRAYHPVEPASYYGSAQDCWLNYIEEGESEQVLYAGLSVLELRMQATDRLSNMDPSVDVVACRRWSPGPTANQWVKALNPHTGLEEFQDPGNPAWAAYELLRNPYVGLGVDPASIDYDAFADWAEFCDGHSPKLRVALYLDRIVSSSQAVIQVATLGMGMVVQRGEVFTCVVDRPSSSQTPRLVNFANVMEGSFRRKFAAPDELSNVIDATFYDKDRDWRPRTFQRKAATYDIEQGEVRRGSMNMVGVDDYAQADFLARFTLRKNELLRESISYRAGWDHIDYQAGDLILIPQDLPEISHAARIESVVYLDGAQTVVVLPEPGWVAPLGQEIRMTVRYSATDIVEFPAPAVAIADAHAPWDALTWYVAGQVVSHAGYVYRCRKAVTAAGIDPGNAEYWGGVVRWRGIFPRGAPAAGDLVGLGVSEVLDRLYRVTEITRASDYYRQVSALEHNDSVYAVGAPPVETVRAAAPAVSALTASVTVGNRLALAWRGRAMLYRLDYRAVGAAMWTPVPGFDQGTHLTSATVTTLPLGAWQFRVRAEGYPDESVCDLNLTLPQAPALAATATPIGVRVTVTPATVDAGVAARTTVYASATNDFATAKPVAVVAPGKPIDVPHSMGQPLYLWATVTDVRGVEGEAQAASAGTPVNRDLGLNVSADGIGYWTGAAWKAVIRPDGSFYFDGSGAAGGQIRAASFATALTGARVEINAANSNEVRVLDPNGAVLASMGWIASAGDYDLLYLNASATLTGANVRAINLKSYYVGLLAENTAFGLLTGNQHAGWFKAHGSKAAVRVDNDYWFAASQHGVGLDVNVCGVGVRVGATAMGAGQQALPKTAFYGQAWDTGLDIVSMSVAAKLSAPYPLYLVPHGSAVPGDPGGPGFLGCYAGTGGNHLHFRDGEGWKRVLCEGGAIRGDYEEAYFEETQANGVDAGAYPTPSAWVARQMILADYNNIPGAYLSGGSMVIPAGTYTIEWQCPAIAIDAFVSRLWNYTANAEAKRGTNGWAGTAASAMSFTRGCCKLTLAVQSVLGLQFIASAANAGTAALGKALSGAVGVERYSWVRIRKHK